jgi:ketopantoate hydroxymethyltransferase
MQRAFSDYIDDVQTKAFPTAEHSVNMAEDEWQALLRDI